MAAINAIALYLGDLTKKIGDCEQSKTHQTQAYYLITRPLLLAQHLGKYIQESHQSDI